jgi:hypothetical protein
MLVNECYLSDSEEVACLLWYCSQIYLLEVLVGHLKAAHRPKQLPRCREMLNGHDL